MSAQQTIFPAARATPAAAVIRLPRVVLLPIAHGTELIALRAVVEAAAGVTRLKLPAITNRAVLGPIMPAALQVAAVIAVMAIAVLLNHLPLARVTAAEAAEAVSARPVPILWLAAGALSPLSA